MLPEGVQTVVLNPAAPADPLDWEPAGQLLTAAEHCQGHPEPLLRVLSAHPGIPPVPGTGNTAGLWQWLATIAAIDLAAARTIEPHLDAAAILRQAGHEWPAGSTWGVYAAEAPHQLLTAEQDGEGTWQLNGTKPWCSLAGNLSRAIVSAHTAQGRRIFAVRLSDAGVEVQQGTWHSRGLAHIPSGSVHFTAVPAQPIGAAGWYLDRPGFAVGAVGVAACWFGGAVGLYRTLFASAQRREPDQLALSWLGEGHRLLHGAGLALANAAGRADAQRLDWADALTVRGHVAAVCQRLLAMVPEATGPGPLVGDDAHARRVADLGIYLRQHHGARDDAALGGKVLQAGGPW